MMIGWWAIEGDFKKMLGDIGYTQGMLGVFPNDEGMTRPFGDIRDIGQLWKNTKVQHKCFKLYIVVFFPMQTYSSSASIAMP